MGTQIKLTKGERTRAHIVATAAGLFWRRSFHGVSVDQVAQEAKVNKATVYRYFADKNALALAVTQFNGAASIELIFEGAFQTYSAPQDRLAAIYRAAYCAHLQMHEAESDVYGCPIVALALELGQELPELRREAQRIFDRVEVMMTKIAEEACRASGGQSDPAMLGRTLTQLLHGAFASARVSNDPGRVLDAGKASLALIGFPHTSILQTEHAA